jgi:hypothetical protein
MMNQYFQLQTFALLLLFCISAFPQGNSDALKMPKIATDKCKMDVLRYQKDIDFVRKVLGNEAALEQEEKFLLKSEWNEILLNEGYCGIARRLYDKKLVK